MQYELTLEEKQNINKVWDFIDLFNKQFVLLSDYRKYLIKTIKNKYDINEFLYLENLTNKLFWNLRWKIMPLWINNNNNTNIFPSCLTNSKTCNYTKEELKNIKNSNLFYKSFINKLIIINKNENKIHYKPMEGMQNIFYNNYFNTLCFMILFNKELYNKVLIDPDYITNNKIKLPKYKFNYEYGFPNMNTIVYDFCDKKEKLYRIQKYYYDDNCETNWFKLL